jgi:hypothetical protein
MSQFVRLSEVLNNCFRVFNLVEQTHLELAFFLSKTRLIAYNLKDNKHALV